MHLNGRVAGAGRDKPHVLRRSMDNKNIIILVAAVVLILALIAVLTCSILRKARRGRGGGQKPDSAESSVWSRMVNSLPGSSRGQYEHTAGDETDQPGRSHQLNSTASGSGSHTTTTQQTSNNNSANTAVDRHTSVRSIMTLPAYRQTASNNEQVLGREGERDGVDVIIDLPTEEHEEALREAEMDSIFQIREARRQQIAEREERRRLRQEAEARRDNAALREIRAQTRAANNSTTIADLRNNVDRAKENRLRSVSSVSYADLGVARHDGTRIRANSNESERMGLLSDAASMGTTVTASTRPPGLHQRAPSASSFVSIDSGLPSPSLNQSRTTLHRLSVDGARAGSSPELVEAELGDDSIPPPDYEDVSLDGESDFRRSISSIPQAPPPDYSGPYRSASRRSGHSGAGDAPQTVEDDEEIPQPNARVSPPLPEIVIQHSNDQTRNS